MWKRDFWERLISSVKQARTSSNYRCPTQRDSVSCCCLSLGAQSQLFAQPCFATKPSSYIQIINQASYYLPCFFFKTSSSSGGNGKSSGDCHKFLYLFLASCSSRSGNWTLYGDLQGEDFKVTAPEEWD